MRLGPVEAASLEKEFLNLLDQQLPEQRYQEFIERNTVLVPREFILNHGVHFDLVIRKISLAKDYTPDFFYMSKSSASWNLVLVEIEKPQSRYFANDKNELHPDFLAALDQIARWRAWFDNPSNRAGFIDGTIDPIRVPTGMRRNPCHIKYVLVHGRRSESAGSVLRSGLIRARQSEDFRIMSYDSLAESLHTKTCLYLGIRKNEHFDIVSPSFISENLFTWVEPTQLRVTKVLKDDILRHRDQWHQVLMKGDLRLDAILPQLAECTI